MDTSAARTPEAQTQAPMMARIATLFMAIDPGHESHLAMTFIRIGLFQEQ
jgi:hypothetical protein